MRGSIALAAALLFGIGCARPPVYDDLVRIRREYAPQWWEALQDTLSGGAFLRGTAIELWLQADADGRLDTFLLFRLRQPVADRLLRIPVAQLENPARRFGIQATEYGGWNRVESYAVTEHIPHLREIPVRTQECDCLPLSVGLPRISYRCPERVLPPYFVELRGVVLPYTDAPSRTSRQGFLRYHGEIAAGMRWGAARQWGVGIAYSTPVPLFNSLRGQLLQRPIALLHLRYQFRTPEQPQRRLRIPGSEAARSAAEETPETTPFPELLASCFRPFVYANVGISVDRLTLRMARFWLSAKSDCSECVRFLRDLEAAGRLPEVDFSLPITWGVGIGIEYPLTRWMDLALDLGWRSIAIGEETALLGFTNVPSTRRLNVFRFRAGVTF